MSSPLLLNSETHSRAVYDENQQLKDRIGELEAEVRMAKSEAIKAKRNADLALGNLKKQLSPLYRALQQVFGELESVGVEEAPGQQIDPRWQSWKQRMPGRPAEFIDLLLTHGSMSVKQFMAAAH